MKKEKKQFTDEQLKVINDKSRLENVFVDLMNIVFNKEINDTQKEIQMFKGLLLYISQRKQDFLNVGIKNNHISSLIEDEINSLKFITLGFQNVVKKVN